MNEFWLIAIAVGGSFIAGFIDAVVGGGGLIQVPLLFILFPNLAHTNIIATNRFASIGGTIVAAVSYAKKIKINWNAIGYAGILATIASISGTFLMHKIPTNTFKPILFGIIIVLTIYTFFKKDIGQTEQMKFTIPKLYIAFAAIGLCMGLYNGIIGPGTGTLLVFSLVQVIGFSFLKASAYAKVINAIADLASLVAFVLQSAVLYKIALPMLFTNMLGGYIGSSIALQKGNRFIRIFFIVILLLLLVRFGWDVLHP
jgi:uncharacterized membrane protein YfcA